MSSSPARSSVLRAVQPIYDSVLRQRLPRKWGVYAGVPARDCPYLDVRDRHPGYKQGLITAIHDEVDETSTVDLVALGRGVSTVHCLRAGARRVNAFEASQRMLDVASETLDTAAVDADPVEITHAIVGEAIHVFGDASGADVVAPDELSGDVLVLDCEGAERSILDGIERAPASVIVETHPEHGAGTDGTREQLRAHGYAVNARQYEPADAHPTTPHPDKRVLVGTTPR